MASLDEIQIIGSNLQRPECVLCTRAGNLYTSDWRGGVSIIHPNKRSERGHPCPHLSNSKQTTGARASLPASFNHKSYQNAKQTTILPKNNQFQVKPNGIALMPDGSFLIAHLGPKEGGVYRLTREGELTPFLLEVNGEPLPPTNYVHLDHKGRIWITVSTRKVPRNLGYRPDVSDGFIVLVDKQGARIVADNLGYTNECIVHPSGRWLYVNETFTRKLSQFEIDETGNLSNKQTVTEFSEGTFPDGLAFDQEEGIWITSIVSNRVIRVDQNGNQEIVLEDNDPDHVTWVEKAFQAGEMGRSHLDGIKSKCLKNISSLAFGGDDFKNAFLGCLLGDSLAMFRTEIAGYPPVHWEYDN